MKIGFLHTKTSIVEKRAFESAINKEFQENVACEHCENAKILELINQNNGINKEAFMGMLALYEELVNKNCDVIVSTCTAATPAANTLQGLNLYTGVPVISVDEGICEQALAVGTKICIVGSSAVAISVLTERVKQLTQKNAVIAPVKVAFTKDSTNDEKINVVINSVKKVLAEQSMDVILLAQPSLNFAVQKVENEVQITTLGAINATAIKLKKLLLK